MRDGIPSTHDGKESISNILTRGAQKTSPRLLIVDDQEDITAVLKIGLQHYGFLVDTYNKPEMALAEFRPGVYDMAIFDISMPKISGFELYRQTKRLDPDLSICFFTALEIYDKEMSKMFPDLKSVALFKKPMDVKTMAERLRGLIENRGAGNSVNSAP